MGLASGALGDPFGTDLQLGFAEICDHPFAVNSKKSCNFLSITIVLDFCLFFLAHWHKVLGEVTHVHHSCGVLEDIIFFLLGESQDIKGFISKHHVFLVINRWNSKFTLGDKPVVQDVIAKKTLLLEVGNLVGHKVIESVVASLKGLLVSQSGFLQEIDNHVSSRQFSSLIEVNTDELSETGGVVIPDSLCITPGLKNRVSLHNLVLKGCFSLLPLARGADSGKVRDDLLGVLSLSSTRLSSNKDRLVNTRVNHALVSSLSNGKDMRPALVTSLADVQLHSAEGVDGESLVRVDGDTEETRVGIDELILVPDNRVPQDTGVTKVGEVGHVLTAVKLGRVDLAHSVLLERLLLTSNTDGNFVSILGLQHTLQVASISLVWDPHRLLRIIGLSLVLGLQLWRHSQPGRRIGVWPRGLLNMAG